MRKESKTDKLERLHRQLHRLQESQDKVLQRDSWDVDLKYKLLDNKILETRMALAMLED